MASPLCSRVRQFVAWRYCLMLTCVLIGAACGSAVAEVPTLAAAREGYKAYLADCERGEATYQVRFHNKRTDLKRVGPKEELFWKGEFWHATGRETTWSDGVQITKYAQPVDPQATPKLVLIRPSGKQDELDSLLNPFIATGKRVQLTPLTLEEILARDEAHIDEAQSSDDLVAISCGGISPDRGTIPFQMTAWLAPQRRFALRKIRLTYDLSQTKSEMEDLLKTSFYEIENTKFQTVTLANGRTVDFPVEGRRDDRGSSATWTVERVVLGMVDEMRFSHKIPEGTMIQDTRGPKPQTYKLGPNGLR